MNKAIFRFNDYFLSTKNIVQFSLILLYIVSGHPRKAGPQLKEILISSLQRHHTVKTLELNVLAKRILNNLTFLTQIRKYSNHTHRLCNVYVTHVLHYNMRVRRDFVNICLDFSDCLITYNICSYLKHFLNFNS